VLSFQTGGRVGAECAAVFVATSAPATPARGGWGRRPPPLAALLLPRLPPTRRWAVDDTRTTRARTRQRAAATAAAVAAAADPRVGAAGAPRGDHLPPLGRVRSAGRRGARGRPLPTSGRIPPQWQRPPLVRAAADAAAAAAGAPPTPASGGHVGGHHHRRHGRLPRLLFGALPLVRALPSGAGRSRGRRCSTCLSIFHSSSESSFIVLQVQGIFAKAHSVGSGRNRTMTVC